MNTITIADIAYLEKTYAAYKPSPTATTTYIELRESARALALQILTECPESRERAVALINLEQALMWAHIAIT